MWIQGKDSYRDWYGNLTHACSLGIIDWVSRKEAAERYQDIPPEEAVLTMYEKAVELLGRQLGDGPGFEEIINWNDGRERSVRK